MFSWLKRKEDPQQALREALGDYELPSFKTAALTALDKLRDPDVALSDVARAIATDPRLSVQVLSVTASAAYSVRHPVKNVAQAVTLLGRSKIEQIVLATAVKSALPSSPVPGFDAHQFWRAAARRATAARVFAQALHPATASESFTAALLSDLAIPLLSHARREQYGRLRHAWRHGDESLSVIETRELGFCHGTVASWACATWKFPEVLARAIAHHHCEDGDLPAVTLASPIMDHEDPNRVDRIVDVAGARYGVKSDHVVDMLEQAERESEEVARLVA
ncbi:MAG TPA: HDOD domain-containing protein [Polyangiaceae bacterium]|mgnify:CR=1 FL=1|nr:HDOD domain-containing protein [Polyangiaceae bacterium]